MMNLRAQFLFPLMILVAIPLHADDGAASVAAGGLVVMKREPRIIMAKEVLQISASKVIVDYDFRNDSDQDITTEVAFPIPDYEFELGREGDKQGFDDFQLWIDGALTRYQVEARAFLKDTEYTKLLTSMDVDVASFGHGVPLDSRGKAEAKSRDIQRLTAVQRKRLEKLGVIAEDCDKDEKYCIDEPEWRVKKKYYWSQTFPAHKTVHIRHEYSPVLGSSNSIKYGPYFRGTRPAYVRMDQRMDEKKTFCIDGRLDAMLQQVADSKDEDAPYSYVDFILTTANTWKTPIEDFTLIVERPHCRGSRCDDDLGEYLSFCWDGPVTKIDADHFSAHTTNLVPAKELEIGFFGVRKRRQ